MQGSTTRSSSTLPYSKHNSLRKALLKGVRPSPSVRCKALETCASSIFFLLERCVFHSFHPFFFLFFSLSRSIRAFFFFFISPQNTTFLVEQFYLFFKYLSYNRIETKKRRRRTEEKEMRKNIYMYCSKFYELSQLDFFLFLFG